MRRYYLLMFACLAVGVIVYVAYRTISTPDNPPPRLPTVDEVESITASISEKAEILPAVAEFSIPKRYLPVIIGALHPAELSDYPASWEEMPLGSFIIKTKAGQKFEVSYCFSGKNILCYMVNGVRCQRGGKYVSIVKNDEMFAPECTMLAGIVHNIFKEQQTGKKNDKLHIGIANLERSRGERPAADW